MWVVGHRPLSIDTIFFKKIFDMSTFKDQERKKKLHKCTSKHDISEKNNSSISSKTQSNGTDNCCTRYGHGTCNDKGHI